MFKALQLITLITIVALLVVSTLLGLTLLSLRREVAKNRSLTVDLSNSKRQGNSSWAMYFEVANRLADLQYHIGDPHSINYVLPYNSGDRYYMSDKSEPFMFPTLYSMEYGPGHLKRCDYTGINVSPDFVKACEQHIMSIYNEWNP